MSSLKIVLKMNGGGYGDCNMGYAIRFGQVPIYTRDMFPEFSANSFQVSPLKYDISIENKGHDYKYSEIYRI